MEEESLHALGKLVRLVKEYSLSWVEERWGPDLVGPYSSRGGLTGEASVIKVDLAGPDRDRWVHVSDLELQCHVEDWCVTHRGFRLGSLAVWILGNLVVGISARLVVSEMVWR